MSFIRLSAKILVCKRRKEKEDHFMQRFYYKDDLREYEFLFPQTASKLCSSSNTLNTSITNNGNKYKVE